MAASLLAAVLVLALGLLVTAILWRKTDEQKSIAQARLDEVLRLADVKRLADLEEARGISGPSCRRSPRR
jgi:hypothetical protein